jgi:hypothetical protein
MNIAGFTVCLWTSGCTERQQQKDDYIVAAWVWPSCHDDERGKELFWNEGPGEWEMIRRMKPLFEGHYQPKQPLWGYEPDDDPEVMERWINLASDHNVNTFIFDWYWYDKKPFLESAVNAFVNAPNSRKMNFYLMWANHHISGTLLNSYRYPMDRDTLIWKGTVDREDFKNVVAYMIRNFFMQPNYLKIDGQPVFAIYRTDILLKSFDNSWEETRKGLDYFRDEVKKAGFTGLHLQLVQDWNWEEPYLLSPRAAGGKTAREVTALLGVNSVTSYNMGKSATNSEDHVQNAAFACEMREKMDAALDVPLFPCVTTGYDNSPRYAAYSSKKGVTHTNSNPESFIPMLLQAKAYADRHPEQPKIIVINAWNEWVEGSYLLPDMKYGFGYLEAVRDVMSGKYDKYINK